MNQKLVGLESLSEKLLCYVSTVNLVAGFSLQRFISSPVCSSVTGRGCSCSPLHWPEEKNRKKTRFQRTYDCLQRHMALMIFKAILQALKGGRLKFIDVNDTTNFSLFFIPEM